MTDNVRLYARHFLPPEHVFLFGNAAAFSMPYASLGSLLGALRLLHGTSAIGICARSREAITAHFAAQMLTALAGKWLDCLPVYLGASARPLFSSPPLSPQTIPSYRPQFSTLHRWPTETSSPTIGCSGRVQRNRRNRPELSLSLSDRWIAVSSTSDCLGSSTTPVRVRHPTPRSITQWTAAPYVLVYTPFCSGRSFPSMQRG